MKRKEQWVKPEVRKAFEAKIAETIAKCQPNCKEPINVPKLVFRNLGGRAGTNRFTPLTRTSVITINPAYFEKEGGYNEQLNKTLPHEVAHHVTDFIHGLGKHNKSHGWQWARTMRWIGLPAERCHKMDVEGIVNRHERPYKYECHCSTPHLLTARKHNKIVNSGGRYRLSCRRCRHHIVYVGLVVNGHFTPVAKPTSKPNNEIKTVRLAPRVIGITFEPPKPEQSKAPEPPATHRTITKFVDGMLQNIRVPIE